MAREGWYRQDSLGQRQSERWDGHTPTFPTAYNSPPSGEEKWPVEFQAMNPYCATDVAQDGTVYGLPDPSPVPDQEAFFATQFYHGVHGDQYTSPLRRFDIDRYNVRTGSMSESLYETYESSPIPFVPGIKEAGSICDGSRHRVDCTDAYTSSDHLNDTDSSRSDQSERGSERGPISGSIGAPSHVVVHGASRVSTSGGHPQFGSSRKIVARGEFVVDEVAQPSAEYTLQCACGLKLKGAHAKGNLGRHQRSKGCTASADSRRVQCPECPQVFWRSDALLNHRRKKHEAPPCRPSRLRRHKGPSRDPMP
ncbi:hypothetical protein PMIN01_06042 [Paraphaeosphaeria minitans]|uniref:C2H2-type domain-containing protein n=1 Tax=Paraphaeosphaeria minitans TaxID=565426 RepID=A0A9P6GI34_9PLEO|nr:hypothetical protein PMIN01_06042 [Paraphaeosphaeria minitans]